MATRKVITEDGDLIPEDPPSDKLPLAIEEIDDCIRRHQAVLVNAVRDSGLPPADGVVLRMIETIEALKKLREDQA